MPTEPENPKPSERQNAASGTSGIRSGDSKPAPAGSKRAALTERQRIEARRRREARRRSARRAQPGNALSRGVKATGQELARTTRFLARAVAAALEATGPLGRRLRLLPARIGAVLAATGRGLTVGAAALSRLLGRGLTLLDRVVTPRRALLAAALLGTLLLIASQFTEFRATEIGQPGYQGIEDVITAPRVDVRTPLDTHSILLLAAAAVAVAGLVGSIRTGRRPFGLALLLAGTLTVVVSLAIDLPAGLDLGDAALGYSGVAAVLLSGFWMQLAAGVVLAWTGLLLPGIPGGRTRTSRTAIAGDGSPA